MKKICVLFIIIYFMIFGYSVVSNANIIELYTPTKEELGGEISIPNRNGSQDHYTDIDTYEELYSVLEELSFEYRELLEEYYEMEDNYKEISSSIEENNLSYEELTEMLDSTEQQITTLKNEQSYILTVFIIVLGITIYISYNKGLNKNK